VLGASCDLGQIERWWTAWPDANIGLDVGGAGLMVLDFDPGSDRDATLSMVNAPTTRCVAKTPRGGEHFFYAIAPDEKVAPSASKIGANVDVRSWHSYVVLAPSVIEGVGAYTWEDQGVPAFRSDEMIRRASSAREKHDRRDEWLVEADQSENIERAIEWLEREARPAIEGQGGDHTAYATACYLRGLGLSPEMSLKLILDHYNPRCEPPWNDGEAVDYFNEKIDHATQYATNPPGYLTQQYRVKTMGDITHLLKVRDKPVLVETTPGVYEKVGRFRFTDDDGIAAMVAPPWLFPGWLPQGAYAIMVGRHGSGKSFIALDMARSIAYGVGGWDPTDTGPVLFAAGEGRTGQKKRVAAWNEYHKPVGKMPFVLADPVPTALNPETVKEFIEGALMLQPDGYKLVIIDTLGRAMTGLNENAQEGASLMTAMVDRLRNELGIGGTPATVMVLHHENKMGKSRGSTVFEADADTVFTVKAKGGELTLAVDKQKDDAPAPAVIWDMTEVLDSLVPVRTDKAAAVAAKEGADTKLEAVKAEFVIRTVERHALGVLRDIRRDYTMTKLASEVEARMEGTKAKTIKNYLATLKSDRASEIYRHYDETDKVWRYVDSLEETCDDKVRSEGGTNG
jgi:hypothetical protein